LRAGRWLTVFATGTTVIVLVVASAMVFGPHRWLDYAGNLAQLRAEILETAPASGTACCRFRVCTAAWGGRSDGLCVAGRCRGARGVFRRTIMVAR